MAALKTFKLDCIMKQEILLLLPKMTCPMMVLSTSVLMDLWMSIVV